MIPIKVLQNNEIKNVALNQRHVCSFSPVQINDKTYTEVRMSNGDIWVVIEPPHNQWLIDQWVTDENY